VYRAGTRLLKYFAKRCKELSLNLDEMELFQEPKAKSARLDDMESDDTIDSEDDDETETRKKR
jgi:hypothetical protein